MTKKRRPRRRSRRLLKLLVLLALCALFLWWSNHALQTQRFTYASPRLPEGFDGCVIVQLSDLHGAYFGEDNQELLSRVREAGPDYIFLTGDLLDQYRKTPRSYAVALGGALADIAPTYFITGNHEWALPGVRELKRELEEAGVAVLSNEYVLLERSGDRVLCCWPTGTTTLKSNTAFWARIWSSPATATGASSACPSPTAWSARSAGSSPPTRPGSTPPTGATCSSPGDWETPGPPSACSTGRRWWCSRWSGRKHKKRAVPSGTVLISLCGGYQPT